MRKLVVSAIRQMNGVYILWLQDKVWGTSVSEGLKSDGWVQYEECNPTPLSQGEVISKFSSGEYDLAWGLNANTPFLLNTADMEDGDARFQGKGVQWNIGCALAGDVKGVEPHALRLYFTTHVLADIALYFHQRLGEVKVGLVQVYDDLRDDLKGIGITSLNALAEQLAENVKQVYTSQFINCAWLPFSVQASHHHLMGLYTILISLTE